MSSMINRRTRVAMSRKNSEWETTSCSVSKERRKSVFLTQRSWSTNRLSKWWKNRRFRWKTFRITRWSRNLTSNFSISPCLTLITSTRIVSKKDLRRSFSIEKLETSILRRSGGSSSLRIWVDRRHVRNVMKLSRATLVACIPPKNIVSYAWTSSARNVCTSIPETLTTSPQSTQASTPSSNISY